MNFEELGLRPELLKAVSRKGYQKATPIQAGAIPEIIAKRDVLGGAQTGTGKTAAFALPILQLLTDMNFRPNSPRALILTPTRELADQVWESFTEYGMFLDLRLAKIFGGVNINPQINSLKRGTDIVIATPGRLLDHLRQKTINLSNIQILVLDEADRMLDMGFIKDIRKIIKALPPVRQNLLFSATYSDEIRSLSGTLLKDPSTIEVSTRNRPADMVEQSIYFVEKNQKKDFLAHLIKKESWFQVLVFAKTKHGANKLTDQLTREGLRAAAIHGNKSQSARTQALAGFKNGKTQILVATDIAARGLDLDNLDHVVNFDLPSVPEDYIHRIGRTGRAGKSGTAVSLISTEEKSQLTRIQRLMNKTIPEGIIEGFVPVRETSPVKSDSLKKNRDQKRTVFKTGEKKSGQKNKALKTAGNHVKNRKYA